MTVSEETGLKESEIGRIPKDWDTISFDKAISHIVDNRGKTAPTSKNGIALIATNCIKENALYPVKERIRYVSKETYENWFRDHPKPDDIIIVNKGTPGMVCLVPSPVDFVIAQDMVAVRPNKSRIYGRFLFAFMRSKIFKHEVDSLNVGTTIPHLKKTYFPLLTVPLPSKDEQTAIGDTYYNLSKKIETNLKMNETLEAIGHAVFNRWFVDFEFPNEGGKPYKSSGGEMIDSEIGEIPKRWLISSLDQLHEKKENCVITGPFGSNLHASDYRETGTPLILVKHVKDGRISGGDMPSVGNHKFPEMNRYLLKIGDIVFTRVAVVGESAYIRKRNENWMISGQMLRVRANRNRINPRYLAQVFQQRIFKDQVSNYAVGSTRPSLNTKLLLSFKFVLPPLRLQNNFSELLEGADAQIENNLNQIDTLSSIRDLLLPKLMSGKIRVPVPKDNVEPD